MARRKKGNPVNGWINLDKPEGLTSTQAIGKVRRILNAQKAGHAGTLDPLATGILPIALGEATKTIPYMQDGLKTYEFTVSWGEQRSTDDREGEVIATSDTRPDKADIIAALPAFTGYIQQVPPQFSAIKIDGQRAYDLARSGEEVELKSREVYIKELKITCLSRESGNPEPGGQKIPACAGMTSTSFEVICGKGTYVRSLARDLAIALGTRGYVKALRRTEVGAFNENNAISLDILEEMGNSAALNEALLPLEVALDDIPALPLKAEEQARLRNGQHLAFVSRPDFERFAKAGIDTKEPAEALAIFQGEPVAIVDIHKAQVKPVKVFNL